MVSLTNQDKPFNNLVGQIVAANPCWVPAADAFEPFFGPTELVPTPNPLEVACNGGGTRRLGRSSARGRSRNLKEKNKNKSPKSSKSSSSSSSSSSDDEPSCKELTWVVADFDARYAELTGDLTFAQNGAFELAWVLKQS